MKILYLIPARGGSKGIPHKNIKPLNGKALIYYTIDAARGVADDKDICVSTDGQDIIKTVEDYGLKVPFTRPAEYATDHASSDDVVKHAIRWYQDHAIDYDLVVLLQPTSPLRTAKHIKEAVSVYEEASKKESIDMVVSVKPSHAANVICEENKDGYLINTLNKDNVRRQDMPDYYEYNGAIYIINVKSEMVTGLGQFEHIKKYVMPEEASWDIDTMTDWKIIDFFLKEEK
jgi:CMP-N,N'-diacetyllegionaminic acid synthase